MPGIAEYVVRQTANGADLEVRTVAAADLESLRRDLTAALARLGIAAPSVSVRSVDNLERSSSGKLKRFIPLEVRGSAPL